MISLYNEQIYENRPISNEMISSLWNTNNQHTFTISKKKTIYDIRHALPYKFRPPKVRQVLADLQIDKRNKLQKGGPKYGQE